MDVDVEKLQREEVRWRILQALNAGRPTPLREQFILRVVNDIDLPVSPTGLRRELDYLEERELLRIHDRKTAMWKCELTRTGIDVVEYTVECDPGIARPDRD